MTGTSKKPSTRAGLAFVGPALATGIAYIDPGNVATNLTGGARFGYSLIWVAFEVLFALAALWVAGHILVG